MVVAVNSGNSKLDCAILRWFQWDKNEKTSKEVEALIAAGDWDLLSKRMLKRLKFGTAGLRGPMAAGVGCMNDVVVLQTAQGLCSYLKRECSETQLKNGLIVGYDGRYNSKRFAELTTKVFIANSIPVHLFSSTCPTPFVSFATLHYAGCGGVMVTASHNPKQDNGYKVFWNNGSQIITPHDDNILMEIERCLDIPPEHWDIDNIRSDPLVSDPLDEIMTAYCDYVRSGVRERVLRRNEKSEAVIYSAMHGVGYPAISKAFRAANLAEPICVMEQRDPDPDFSTVEFPNPEELSCLTLGQRLAEYRGMRLLLVNDPDADRLAVAELDNETMEWKIFSGNEMGALLGWWLLQEYQESGSRVEPGDVFLLGSVVSSKLLKAIAENEGCRYVETLTGFKWMGNKTKLLLEEGKLPLFAFEEAIGYMCSARVPDKDGVTAAVQVASLANHLYLCQSSLRGQLEQLHREHGYHVSHNYYYVCHEPQVFERIFRRIRDYDGTGTYPTRAGGLDIVEIRDLVTGANIRNGQLLEEGDTQDDNAAGTGLDLPYSGGEMVMLRCANTLAVTVRTSGTEPKLKVYTEMVTRFVDAEKQEEEKEKLVKIVEALMEDLIEPAKNGLL